MTWFQFFMFISMLWWVVFFIMLPIGLKTPEEAGEEPVRGQGASAPVNPMAKKKALYSTIIAIIIGLAVKAAFDNGVIAL